VNTKSKWVLALAIVLICMVITTHSAQAQPLTTLYSFPGTDGAEPMAGLVQATNGNFYGTTLYTNPDGGGGTVFEITPGGGTPTSFGLGSMAFPTGGLVQATNGDLYGTTSGGGIYGAGSVFKITLGGVSKTIYSFCSQTNCPDGLAPIAGLIQATNGDFYGTTRFGGANDSGTVFKVTPEGALTTRYSFCSQSLCADGGNVPAGLIQAEDGDFYGTTQGGGANGDGTVFKITSDGALTTLYSFCSQTNCADGTTPTAGLIQATDGYLYGTTFYGGYLSTCMDCGTIFKMTSTGDLTTLHTFGRTGTDGSGPMAGLIQATDGDFYGTTEVGGAADKGTIFKITSARKLTTLHSFCSKSGCPDGNTPYTGLIQATDGEFYGTTPSGGPNGNGTVFSLSVDLGPFVETQTASGRVETAVTILGSNLTGSTSVTFNGTAATFTVVSASEITTTVPAGATTGFVEVTTPGGTLTSNKKFTVKT